MTDERRGSEFGLPAIAAGHRGRPCLVAPRLPINLDSVLCSLGAGGEERRLGLARDRRQGVQAKIGQSITIFVQVEMESERTDLYESAKRSFSNAPEVQQCYYITGEADFILVVTVNSMSDYEALTRQLFFENNNVKRFRTFVAMDRVKVGMSVPI